MGKRCAEHVLRWERDVQTRAARIDAQSRKIDEQSTLINYMMTAVKGVQDSQENLTRTLLNFLDDAKKGEGAEVSKEQRGEQQHQQQYHQYNLSYKEGPLKPKVVQKPSTETVSPAEMEEFKTL
ncbi:hypothetical protein Dimus_001079 [Dionaea muscipula]